MAKVGKSTGKGRTTREAAKLIKRRADVFRRWNDGGESQMMIALDLGVSQQTISMDIQLAMEEWRAAHRGSISQQTEMELKRLYYVQNFAEWNLEETSDPKWADLIIKCSAERRKLLGIDAPTRSEIMNSDVTVRRDFKTHDEMHKEVGQLLEQFRERMTSNN